jgi:hypothetical protein
MDSVFFFGDTCRYMRRKTITISIEIDNLHYSVFLSVFLFCQLYFTISQKSFLSLLNVQSDVNMK